jgi:anti-sigma B factor antagonist
MMARYRYLKIREIDGVTVVRLLDPRVAEAVGVGDVARELVQLIETEGREKLVLNLSSVQFLASAALGELIAVHKKVAAHNGCMKLCCVHPELGRLFTVTRLDSLFDIAASEADAVAALGGRN